MARRDEIKSEKILLKDVFKKWFRIPEYQRPYVWGYDQINDLLDDITFASHNKPNAEYFLGSIVFQSKPADKATGREFEENDLLDGQQRMATILLLLAVLRDTSANTKIKETCQTCIFQEENKYLHVPERVRLVFDIRDSAKEFVSQFVKADGGTKKTELITLFSQKAKDTTVENMAEAITIINNFLSHMDQDELGSFLDFLLNNVLMIYVSTEDFEDAFRLFTILNDRGIPLEPSDILKAVNLGMLDNQPDKIKHAKIWEQSEGELGDDFGRFLAYIRTILVKEKARLGLVQEFEDNFYNPKEKDRSTGKLKPSLLSKGKPTFLLVEQYLAHYRQLFDGQNYDTFKSFAFDNLVQLMTRSLPSTDWIPPLMRYYDKFGNKQLLEFVNVLNRKFAGDWLSQQTPTYRIEAMNDIIQLIDDSKDTTSGFLANVVFNFDSNGFLRAIEGDVYGKRFAQYILLTLDFLYQNQDQKMHFETLSVEHILPQTPDKGSQWVRDFTDAERAQWTGKLGNLVLITRRKNSAQGNLDYLDKKKRYFANNIDTCPNSLRVLNSYTSWKPADCSANHQEVLHKLKSHFGI